MQVSRAKLLGAGTALAAFGPSLLGPFIATAQAADEDDVALLNSAILSSEQASRRIKMPAPQGCCRPRSWRLRKASCKTTWRTVTR